MEGQDPLGEMAAPANQGTPITPHIEAQMSGPRTSAGRFQRMVWSLLQEHDAQGMLPTSGRFLYYELRQRGLITSGDDKAVTVATKTLRDRGLVPWSWMLDETRWVTHWSLSASVKDNLMDALNGTRMLSPWGDQIRAPLVLVESRSLGGVLRDIAEMYGAPLGSSNGQAGGFLVTDVAPMFVGNEREVVYLGDLDWGGAKIEANNRTVVERHAGRPIVWERIAITDVQAQSGLYLTQRKVRQNRPRDPLPGLVQLRSGEWEYDAWETEALGQAEIRRLLAAALAARLPEPLADVNARERVEKDAASAHMKTMP